MRWKIAGVVLVVLAGAAAAAFMDNAVRSCTQIGCRGDLRVTLANNTSPEVFQNTYLMVDGTVLVDKCQNTSRIYLSRVDLNAFSPDAFSLEPAKLGHSGTRETISEFELGYRPSCSATPNITHRATDIPVEYTKLQPNGPGCSPTCLQGEITIN